MASHLPDPSVMPRPVSGAISCRPPREPLAGPLGGGRHVDRPIDRARLSVTESRASSMNS
jgi:hypothetical protein